jgi:predicted ATPase
VCLCFEVQCISTLKKRYCLCLIIEGPLFELKEKIESNELLPDEHQMQIAHALQRIYNQVQKYQPPEVVTPSDGVFSKFFGPGKTKLDPSQRVKGLYIYGSVGGGKTML